MMIILAFLFSLVAAQTSDYTFPASIIGPLPLTNDNPVNYIEPNVVYSRPIVIRYKSDLSYIYATITACLIFSTVIIGLDSKKKRINPVYEQNIYFQPLPPIQEEDENADNDEQDDPIHLHYVNPHLQATCGDPCICT
jgi:hypothetical protein